MCNKTGKKRKFDFNVQWNTTAVKKPTAAAGEDGQRTEMPSPWLTITWTNSLQNTMLNTTTNHNSIVILGTHNYLKITFMMMMMMVPMMTMTIMFRSRSRCISCSDSNASLEDSSLVRFRSFWFLWSSYPSLGSSRRDFDDFDCDFDGEFTSRFWSFCKTIIWIPKQNQFNGIQRKIYVFHGSYSTSIVRT